MKAILCTRYGPPETLDCKEIDKPVPGDGQVLVKIVAASVNPVDMVFTGGLIQRMLTGFRKPKNPRLGSDIAGRVDGIGAGVTQFHPGDEVFGTCRGGFAEYALARADRLVTKPANISFEQAAAVPIAAITALQGLRDFGHIQSGQRVLIYSASGGVGSFALQIAKSYGAYATAVCSPKNIDIARSLGADYVIDYTHEDFTQGIRQYDLILAINGYHPIWEYRRILSPKGIFVMVGASHDHLFQSMIQSALIGPLLSKSDGQKLGLMGIAKLNLQDLLYLRGLLESGKLIPLIDRQYPFCEAIAALRHLNDGHARGKIIITLE
jgi:NADPH:quinone reductase-like Zn-dependent oxidoreductase